MMFINNRLMMQFNVIAGLGAVCSENDPCTDVLGRGESECVRVYGSCEPTCQCSDNSYESTVDNTCQLG